jgi:AcrR family transcriptional regulator
VVANPPTPQERRKAQTRRDIIETAHQMIVERGVHGFSIRALADSIDYTPGALYKYFESKEALVDAVRENCFTQLNAFVAKRSQQATSIDEMLLSGGLGYIEYASLHPQEYHLMFNMESSNATTGEQRTQAMLTLLNLVNFGISQGVFVETEIYDANTIASHCWTTVHGIASLQSTILLDEQRDPLELSRIILRKVIDGFRA